MEFADAMAHRFACRAYQDKPVDRAVIESILSYGRLTPSSFGWEGWCFHVVQGSRRTALRAACFDQACVASAPFSVVLLARPGRFYDPDGPFIASRAARTWDPKAAVEDFRGFEQDLARRGILSQWSIRQCYLAAANMATGAKTLGVDSVILEGFDEDRVLEVLALRKRDWRVALVIPMGYAAEAERPKLRLPLEDLVVWDS